MPHVTELRRWSLITAVAATIFGVADPAGAQCGVPPSNCRQCHEISGESSFVATDAWHRDHAFGDFCVDCHGGTRSAYDDTAHMGLADPLANAGQRCASCHADKPGISSTYVAARGAPGPPRPPTSARPPEPRHRNQTGNRILAGTVLCVGVLVAFYVVVNERRRRAGAASDIQSARTERGYWSPYLAGSLLGIVVAFSMALFGHRLSGGGAYQELAAPIGRTLAPRSVYFSHVVSTRDHWDVLLLVGALWGALIAAVMGGRFRFRIMPDTQWADAFGNTVAKRWIVAFAGAALTEFAAGVAGGCTASLAVSGGAALAPAAFAFMAGMFAAGTPTAWLLNRRTR